jgi:hypothetical protein
LVELKHAEENRPMNAVAWIARNLVELAVWTEYCAESSDNAVSFFHDSGRDAAELMKMPDSFSKDPAFSFKTARVELLKEAAEKGVHDLDERYQAVRDAANTIGQRENYIWLNKLLSKFAHPTSLWIMTDHEHVEPFRDLFAKGGRTNAEGALETIAKFRDALTSAK